MKDAPATDLPDSFPKVLDALRAEGLLPTVPSEDDAAFDITREPLVFPVPRSAALATMARAETGSLLAIAYSNMRGYGDVHPTMAELRVGYLPVMLPHPVTGELVEAGEVLVTECEVVAMYAGDDNDSQAGVHARLRRLLRPQRGQGDLDGHPRPLAAKGHGRHGPTNPSEDPEFVLLHVDGVDSMGFATHYKMPHYVTFQSDMDRLRTTQEKARTKRRTKQRPRRRTQEHAQNSGYELPQDEAAYSFGFLDEYAKREVRRTMLKAICLPGYQVPYASREMPMRRGFGTGGLQSRWR